MPNTKVSVIIPHWNGIDVLSECLDSLGKSTYKNIEIIVVDNASTDGVRIGSDLTIQTSSSFKIAQI